MLASLEVPELGVAGVSAAYRRCVEDACPEQLPLAIRLFERLAPERWTLEWYLPWWLGHAFGLDVEISNELVLGNVLGLSSLRLQDDLMDGDVSADDVEAATTLSAALYREAVARYRASFPASSPFWSQLDACMATWHAATRDTARGDASGDGEPGDALSSRLAAAGAPLKISAYAVCLLTNRGDAFPVLDRCLDHALTGLVLYDHVGDWRVDLADGRWNAFVAGVSDYAQEPEFRDRNRSRVLLAMMTEDAIADHFARITMEMSRAAALGEELELWPLAAHLRGLAARAEAQGATLQLHYRTVAERAGTLLLGASEAGRSRGGHSDAAAMGRG